MLICFLPAGPRRKFSHIFCNVFMEEEEELRHGEYQFDAFS